MNLIDNNYKYEIVSKLVFDNKYLFCKTDGSKYKKYLLVAYKEDNEIKFIDIPNENYLNKINNIVKVYNVEEIISSCIHFDGMYDEANYYHVDDIYFIKYLMDEDDYKQFKKRDDYEEVKKYFDK